VTIIIAGIKTPDGDGGDFLSLSLPPPPPVTQTTSPSTLHQWYICITFVWAKQFLSPSSPMSFPPVASFYLFNYFYLEAMSVIILIIEE
jgi:hypothetical protein